MRNGGGKGKVERGCNRLERANFNMEIYIIICEYLSGLQFRSCSKAILLQRVMLYMKSRGNGDSLVRS